MIEKFLIVDGHNIASRAYFTNLYGFYDMISQVVDDVDPDYVAIVFDSSGRTWRHDLYNGYKASRKTDPDRQAYIASVKASLDGLVPVYAAPGEEADDIIASLSKGFLEMPRRCEAHCYILSNDSDLLALVGAQVSVIAPTGSFRDRVTHDSRSVFEKMGVWPQQIADYKAMVGDASDDIPGVHLIGPKGACKLLAQYEDKTGILNAIADAAWSKEPRWARLINASMENFELSYNLAELRTPAVEGPELTRFQGKAILQTALRRYRAKVL